jgi:hypothetical protein
MVRIVTTMTVIPTREVAVIRAIMSVQRGNVKPDAMYINIPNEYARFKEKLEPWLKPVLDAIGVTIIQLEHDRCCLNKILPILAIEKDPETLVVTIDDDIIYSPLFIAGLLEGHKKFGGVVGYSGLQYPDKVQEEGNNPMEYHILMGHGRRAEILQQGFGTMTKLSSLYDFPNVPPLEKGGDATMYLSDDYIVSRFYDFKKIPKFLVCWDQIGRLKDDWSSICTLLESQEHALSVERRSLEDYLRCSEIVKHLWNWPYPNLNNVGSS